MHRLAFGLAFAIARVGAADPIPLAVSLVDDAHAAAVRHECSIVEMYAYQIRELDPALYRARFVTDPAIVACDPRAKPPASPEPAGPRVEHATGLAVALGYGLEQRGGFAPTTSPSADPSVQVTFGSTPTTHAFVGAQLASIAFGGTLAFQRVAFAGDATTMLRIGPAIRAAVWRSRSGAMELVGTGEISYGHIWDSATSGANVFELRAGVGLRYWLSPSFAIAATTSVQVDSHTSVSDSFANTSTMAIDNALEIVGVL